MFDVDNVTRDSRNDIFLRAGLTSYRAIALLLCAFISQSAQATSARIEGILYSAWGDARAASQAPRFRSFVLTDSGERVEFELPRDRNQADVFALSGQRVSIAFTEDALPKGTKRSVRAVDFQPLSVREQSTNNTKLANTSAVQGSRRYVSLLCKFADKPSEQRPISYFDAMYGNLPGQLGHYWREVSSNQFDLSGSQAYGGTNGRNGWFTMSKPLSSYVDENETDLELLFEDCVAAADPFVDFSLVDGINLMFNDEIGCCAWGGTYATTLDGVTRLFPTTWEPDWAWSNVAVLAHEIGHSLGLPHSNNSDLDTDPYDSPWTVMSNAFEGFTDPIFGLKGVHLNAHEKDALGWVSSNEIYTIANNGRSSRITLHFLDRSAAGSGAYRMAVFNQDSDRRFTIEARRRGGTYEGLPGTAVIIHSIDRNRSEPAWIVDATSPPATFSNNAGVMWRVGETYVNKVYGLTVRVISQSINGFVVEFETEADSAFNTTVPTGAISLLLED